MKLPEKFLKTPLTSAQKEGIRFFLNSRSAGMRHGTGSGKTLLSLAASSLLLKRGMVDAVYIFVIKAAFDAYKSDLEKHTYLKYKVVMEPEDWSPDNYLYIIQYNRMERIRDRILGEDRRLLMVADEIFCLKGATSGLRKGFDSIRHKFGYVLGLTAVPLSNELQDLYNITNYIAPGFAGTPWDFKNRFCVLKKGRVRTPTGIRKYYEVVGYKNLDIFREIVAKYWHSFFMEMRVDFHLQDSPEVDMTKEERALYCEAAEGVLADGEGVKNFVNRLPDLEAVVDDSLSKKSMVAAHVNYLIANGKGVILFFTRKVAMEDMKKRIKAESRLLTGATSIIDRTKIREWFGPGRVILMTWAGARSLNLEAGNQVVLYTTPWELELFIQLIGRMVRPLVSKFEKVDVWIPVVKGTIDVYRKEIVLANASLISKVLEGSDPNIPGGLKEVKRSLLVKMRKELLWISEKR